MFPARKHKQGSRGHFNIYVNSGVMQRILTFSSTLTLAIGKHHFTLQLEV